MTDRDHPHYTNYPPLPEPKHSRIVDGLPCITVYEHQNMMRAYVDADRTMRAQVAPTYQQVVDAWNAQASETNQWDNLGEDEKIEWAVACAKAAPPAVVPIGWYVTGCSRILDEHDAKAEARHIGGSAQALPLCTSPTVVEPLTPEAINAMAREHPAEDLCGWSYRMGVADAEQHYGIKGGQHG